jgi:hypothetical protein
MGIVSTALHTFAGAAGVVGDTGEDLACLVCSDGPTPGLLTYAGAASALAGVSGRISSRFSALFDDIAELRTLGGETIENVAGLFWEGVNADMDAETASGNLNPDGSPDVNPYSWEMRNDMTETIADVAEETQRTGPHELVIGIALDSAKVMHDIGRLYRVLTTSEADRDSKGLNVIAEERAKRNPSGDSD